MEAAMSNLIAEPSTYAVLFSLAGPLVGLLIALGILGTWVALEPRNTAAQRALGFFMALCGFGLTSLAYWHYPVS